MTRLRVRDIYGETCDEERLTHRLFRLGWEIEDFRLPREGDFIVFPKSLRVTGADPAYTYLTPRLIVRPHGKEIPL